MPPEYESPREAMGVRTPPAVHRVFLLGGAALMTISLIRNGGDAGALTAVGAGGLGLGLGWLARRGSR